MYRSKLFQISVVAILSIFVTSGFNAPKAEGVGEIINLFGRVIQNDIQRKNQQKRQQDYERQVQAERQAQINAEREFQIQQVKRAQTALKRLGFYKKRIDGDAGPGTQKAINAYLRAFNLRNFQLEEYDISQLERNAASGFRSAAEAAEVRDGGFDNAGDMREAKSKGFANAADWYRAESIGFKTKSDFDAFIVSGFGNKSEFEVGRRAGFSNNVEFQAARKAGFSDQKTYASFLTSGYNDKASFDAALRAKAQLASSKAQCEADVSVENWVNAVATCQTAMGLAPSDENIAALNAVALEKSIALVSSLEVQKVNLRKEIDTFQAATLGETEAERVKRELKVTRLENDLMASSVKLDSILASKKGGECENAFRSKDWLNARELCGEANKLFPNERWAELSKEASEKFEDEQELVAAEEAKKSALAAKETKRLALTKAVENSKALISDIEAFAGEGGSFQDGLGVAQALIGLRGVVESSDASIIERKYSDLNAVLDEEQGYQKFLTQRSQANAVATANAAAAAKDEAQRNSQFLLDFIGKNVTYGKISDLLTMKGTLDDALSSGSLERITLANKDTTALLDANGLSSDREAYFTANPEQSLAEQAAENLFKAENGLAITEANKALLEGEGEDVLVLYSKAITAPHVAVNLLGQVTFVDGIAKGCWAHASRPEALRLRFLGTELTKLGASRLDTERMCAQSDLAEMDLVILERKAFLGEPVDDAQNLINSYVTGELSLLYTLDKATFEKTRFGSGENAELISSEVKASARSGFGFIAVNNGNKQICAVVDDNGQSHQLVLDSLSEDLLYLLNGPSQLKGTNLEAAFLDLQKARCGTLYSKAADMKLVLTALERQSIDHTVIPLWITDQQIADAEKSLADAANAEAALAAQKQKEFMRRQAELAQLEEGRAELAAKLAQDQAAENAAKQVQLRQQYEKSSSIAFRELEKIIATHISAEPVGSDKRSTLEATKIKFAELFPSAASWFVSEAQADEQTRRILERANFQTLFPDASRWLRNGRNNGWILDSVAIDMADYGRAVWKTRFLEAVLSDTTIRIKNRELGEYRTYCFRSGMMIDEEFAYIRSPVEGQCKTADESVQAWKVGNRFESFWIVE